MKSPTMIARAKKGEKAVEHLTPVSFEAAGIREVQDLQKWILGQPGLLGEELLILSDQYSKFEEAKDRLDILCVDHKGHPVVVELKRTPTAGYADLQSLRYAALVRTLEIDDAARALSKLRRKNGKDLSEADAKGEILEFIEGDEEGGPLGELQSEPRIIIASPEFSPELLTTVHYLKEHDVDIKCISLKAYDGGDHFILVPNVEYPLRAIEDVTRGIRKKDEARQSVSREHVDRAYWETRAGKESMRVVDSLFKILAESDDSVQPSFSRGYIRPRNRSGDRLPMWIHPEKKPLRVDVELADSQKATEWKGKLKLAGLEADSNRPEVVRFKLTPETLERRAGIVKEFLKEAYSGD